MPSKTIQDVEITAPLWLNKNRKAFLKNRRIELLEKIEEHGSISKASKAMGMSYKGAWDAVNTMNNLADEPLTINVTGGRTGGGATLTEEGRNLIQMFRMIETEHGKALLNLGKNSFDVDRALALMQRVSMRLSAKNVCFGVVRGVKVRNLQAEVCIELKTGHQIFSAITVESVETLCLGVGDEVYAVIKASSVMIATSKEGLRLSAGNQLPGRVVSIRTDAVMGEVVLDIGGGDTISATVTASGAQNLGLKEGDQAVAIIDAANIIIGIE